MKTAKALAVVAALFFIAAVALGTLVPGDLSLGEGLASFDKFHLAATERFVRLHLSAWLWDHPLKALLVRPLWLVPAALGLILAGGSATAATSNRAPSSRRRRS